MSAKEKPSAECHYVTSISLQKDENQHSVPWGILDPRQDI